MSDVLEMTAADQAALDSEFVKQLVLQVRAQDTYGTWEGKSDAEILGPFIVTKEQRKQMPIIGDPDPDIIWRVEIFYAAVGLTIEKYTGKIASPMMKMSHEGFGRMLLTTGKLVVLNTYLRDIHRFGFLSLEKLGEKGTKLVEDAVETIKTFQDAADA